MKDLLSYIIKSITGSDEFEIIESEEENRLILTIKAAPSIIGMIIGKKGETIRSIRKVMSIKATLDNVLLNVAVEEK